MREEGILVTIAAAPPEDAAEECGVRAELRVTIGVEPRRMGPPGRTAGLTEPAQGEENSNDACR